MTNYECNECESHCKLNYKINFCLEVNSGKEAKWHECAI